MIYKKPTSKYWFTKFQITFAGKVKRVHCSTRETVKSRAEAFEQRLREETLAALSRSNEQIGSWDEALLLYLDSRQNNKTIHEKTKKLTWWSSHLALMPLTDINARVILTTLASKTGISLATKNRYLAEIKGLLNFVHKELEWIERVPHLKIYKEREKSFYKLTEKDSARLIDHAPAFLQPIIIFALATGFRASNIIGLKWSHVDLEHRTLKVDADSHKSGSAILVPMNSIVFDLLTSLHLSRKSQFVFPNQDNSPIKDLNRRIWARTIKAAGLEGLRFHDLRHNWASRHAESGTDLLAIKELGGWKTLEMVQRYTHPSLGYLSQQANNIVTKDSDDVVTKTGCDKKSSHFVEINGLKIKKDKAQKWKNLIVFNKLSGSNDGASTRDRTRNTRTSNRANHHKFNTNQKLIEC